MKVNLVLAGLKHDNVSGQLQRLESLISSLPQETEYVVYQMDSENVISEIKGWACRLKSAEISQTDDIGFTLFAGTPQGKELAMRYAAAKDLPCHTEIVSLNETFDGIKAVRKVYSTHLDAAFPARGCILAASASGDRKEYEQGDCAECIVVHDFELLAGDLVKMDPLKDALIHETKLEKGADLSAAKLVLLGGKGLGKKENFQRLEALAEKLGASCGCTRPVAMAGWASYDKVVGISGSVLSADVCIAFGVSGAGPLMAGASGASRLVAVNNDPKAPIFSQCSDGIVADCMEILSAMEQLAEQEV